MKQSITSIEITPRDKVFNITQITGFSNTTLPTLLVCDDTEDAKLVRLQ